VGRIKTTLIKRVTCELTERFGDKITDNFEKNKQLVSNVLSVPSKKIRNVIAGYVTRLVKKSKQDDRF